MRMKIAQVAPLFEAVPPIRYGGTERVMGWLTDGLTARGHAVTLFACGGSRIEVEKHLYNNCALRLDGKLHSDTAFHLAMIEDVRDLAGRFDVIHFHTEMLHMPAFKDLAGKTLTTLHNRLDVKGFAPFYRRFSMFPLVSVSQDQRRALPGGNFAATVYHGLPENLLRPLKAPARDYLAFLGRFSPEKGPHEAVSIARRAGFPLRIGAKICRQDPAHERYYAETISPLLDKDGVSYLGEIDDVEKRGFLGHAKALLMPITWPEPFGLVLIEAMACGTPVIAYGYGAIPEVVEHGVTGFVVRNEDEAVKAVGRLDELDRSEIRKRFEARFTSRRMVDDYLALYRKAVEGELVESYPWGQAAGFGKSGRWRQPSLSAGQDI